MSHGLPPADEQYFTGLLEQFSRKNQTPQLKLDHNFFPSAVLNPRDRKNLLGAVDYGSLLKSRARYEKAAKKTVLILNPMNGGIGTSLDRRAHLEKIWKILGKKGPVRLGAKGSDLYFEIKLGKSSGYVSISEAKILRAIDERKKYAGILLQELVSSETAASVNELLNTINIFHRLKIPSPWGKKTYAQILRRTRGLSLKPPLIQAALPTIDESGTLSRKKLAPGGHGHWGVYFLLGSLTSPKSRHTRIHAVYNEDGINNLVDPVIVGWMAEEKVPLAMLATAKTAIDKKGGLLGLEKLEDGSFKKNIFEEAQAKEADQQELFVSMGLTPGTRGKQYFNTNTALINDTVMAPFMRDLKTALGQDSLRKITAPSLIRNAKANHTQLEGALGSSLLNLDGFLQTTKEPKVLAILQKHGMLSNGRVHFLRIVNAEEKYRERFFTPIKTLEDFWLQFKSGAYRFDVKTWTLVRTGKKDLQAPPAAPWDLL